MREYGQVQCAFWQSDLGNLTDDAKLLALYLMTGPHSNGSGCYPCPIEYAMGDLQWSSERVQEGFAELSQYGFAYRFGTVVFIRKYLSWNPVANANVALARMKEFRALPSGDGKALLAMAILRYCKHFSPDYQAELRAIAATVTPTVAQTVWQTRSDPIRPNPTQIGPDRTRARDPEPDAAGIGKSRDGASGATHRAQAGTEDAELGSDEWQGVEGIDHQAMRDWMAHRAGKGKPLTPLERIAAAKLLAGMGSAERQRAAVLMASGNGWMNLRMADADKALGKSEIQPYRRRTAAEIEAEEQARAAG